MKGKPLTAEMVSKIEGMLARGVKVSVIIQALDVCQKTVYDVKAGKIQARMKEKQKKQNAKSTDEQGDPICENSKCFACRVDFGRGRCIALNNNSFGNRKCPFFKTRERMDFEERKTNLRLEELGIMGVDYE